MSGSDAPPRPKRSKRLNDFVNSWLGQETGRPSSVSGSDRKPHDRASFITLTSAASATNSTSSLSAGSAGLTATGSDGTPTEIVGGLAPSVDTVVPAPVVEVVQQRVQEVDRLVYKRPRWWRFKWLPHKFTKEAVRIEHNPDLTAFLQARYFGLTHDGNTVSRMSELGARWLNDQGIVDPIQVERVLPGSVAMAMGGSDADHAARKIMRNHELNRKIYAMDGIRKGVLVTGSKRHHKHATKANPTLPKE